MTMHLKQTFDAAIMTQLYPRSQIDIFVEVRIVIEQLRNIVTFSVADPGFPVGGGGGGAPTSDAGAFRQKCMRKQKNWVSFEGACTGSTPWICQ